MLKNFILFLLLIEYSTACVAQNKLLFQKKRYRQAYYYTGDVISFKVKGSRAKITDEIIGFDNGSIVFLYDTIKPRNISYLYVDEKTKSWYILRYKYEKIFLVSGIAYPLLDLLNNKKIHKGSLVVGGSLVTAGLLAKFLISKKMKIKGKRRLLVIH